MNDIAKEAERIIELFYNYQAHQVSVETRKAVAKEHSLICIDEKIEIARLLNHDNHWRELNSKLHQVKKHITDNY